MIKKTFLRGKAEFKKFFPRSVTAKKEKGGGCLDSTLECKKVKKGFCR